jgi:predicted MPP superfamily phosphohydrolase
MQQFTNFGVPIYAVLGNHDHDFGSINPLQVVEPLTKAGVTLLRNKAVSVQLPHANFLLVGADDLETTSKYHAKNTFPSPQEYALRAKRLTFLEKISDHKSDLPIILLGHNPDSVYLPLYKQPFLALAGHTHGGQVIFLQWFTRILYRFLPQGSFTTWAGRKKIGNTTLLVSRGFGGSALPVRFLCPPEVIEIILE